MRVALINPPPPQRTERWDRADFPHIGLGYLAGVLRSQDISVAVLDGKLERIGVPEVLARLRELTPGLVGMSAMTHEIEIAADLAEQIKRTLPGTPVVVGGVHATALPAQTLREFPVFDAAIFGEGERTLVEVVRAREAGVPPAKIAGLAWRREGEVVQEPARPWLSAVELEQLPLPAWDLFPRARTYPVLTARGCPFGCIFCARPYGRIARIRSAESVLREFAWLLDSVQPRYIKVYDETFGIDRERTRALLDGLCAMDVPRRAHWWAHTRVSLADESLLEHMARAGCDHVGFGIESGNPEILRGISKDVDLEKAGRLVAAAKRAGMATEGFYIIGLPHETRATAWDTIRYAAGLNTRHVSIGLMVPYPGTEIYEMARRGAGGYRLISSDWRDFNKQLGHALELEGLTRPEMERLQLIGYVYFFLRNGRIFDFLRFCWQNHVEGWAFLRRFVPKLLGLRRDPRAC
jgi:anaerobic magnesium-protoporphyrin IX monomethyl ester cyclase